MPSRRVPNQLISARRRRNNILSSTIAELSPNQIEQELSNDDDLHQTTCDNPESSQCSRKCPCLKHQQQRFRVVFDITTQGGPLIDPLNYHKLWQMIAKKSKYNRASIKPKLKGFKLSKKQLSELDKDEICPICQSKYEQNDIVTKTCCGHMFHKKCLKRYFQKESEFTLIYKCPMCRKYLATDNTIKQNFHIQSRYMMTPYSVVCDQQIFDFTPRIYSRRNSRLTNI